MRTYQLWDVAMHYKINLSKNYLAANRTLIEVGNLSDARVLLDIQPDCVGEKGHEFSEDNIRKIINEVKWPKKVLESMFEED